MKNGKNECCGIVPLEHEISECADPAEIAKKVRLAFKKMPEAKMDQRNKIAPMGIKAKLAVLFMV